IDLTAQQPEQDTPAVSSDTPEQFAADLYDFMDQLHQKGVLKHPWTSDPREQSIADLVTEMQNGYFEGVHSPLAYIAAHTDTDLIKVKALTERMNALAVKLEGQEQARTPTAPEQKYVYQMDTDTLKVNADDQHFIQAYEMTENQMLIPGPVLFVGTADVCRDLLEQLQNGTLQQDDFFIVSAARISCYTTKDGAALDAFVAPDDKVYLGRRDHYDNRGHYLNNDHSLIHISDNERVFNVISGINIPYTQDKLLEMGYFTQEEYERFTSLQLNIPQAENETERNSIQPVSEDAALPDTTLDEYPLPDSVFQADELERNYGYMEDDLLPLGRDRAVEMLSQDFTVYVIVDGGSAEMLFDREDLEERPLDVMFAVSKEEWETSPAFHQAIVERLDHQEEREQDFLNHAEDCFAIYQVKDGDEQIPLHYISMDRLKEKGLSADRSNYDLVYTAALPDAPDINAALDALWEKFNLHHPADYHRPSMSVSDTIAIRKDGVLSCHYCDSIGFQQVPDFIADGSIQPTVAELETQVKDGRQISLMDLAGAVQREQQAKKKSVVKKLKNQPKQEYKKTAPRKGAEKER
ncbi:MAG: hypothetical protein K2O18_11120, partial [Oscillospiraceae bacterium]|nr:hypothetical protein [Oscillospiraceae bacterium]